MWVNDESEGIKRTKTMYRGSYQGEIGVHLPRGSSDPVVCSGLGLAHVVDIVHRERRGLVDVDAHGIYVLDADLGLRRASGKAQFGSGKF